MDFLQKSKNSFLLTQLMRINKRVLYNNLKKIEIKKQVSNKILLFV